MEILKKRRRRSGCLCVYLPKYICVYIYSSHLSVYISINLTSCYWWVYVNFCTWHLISLDAHICLSIYLSILPIYLSLIFISIYKLCSPTNYLSVYLSVYLPIYPRYNFIHLTLAPKYHLQQEKIYNLWNKDRNGKIIHIYIYNFLYKEQEHRKIMKDWPTIQPDAHEGS